MLQAVRGTQDPGWVLEDREWQGLRALGWLLGQEAARLSSSSLLPFGLISSSISGDTGNTDFYVSSLPF